MRFAPLLLLAAACAPRPAPVPREGALTPQEILIASKPSTDPARLKVGQWILLAVSADGDPRSHSTRIQVTGEEADGWWIEQKVPGEPRPTVFKSKIGRDGSLLEGWVGEPGSPRPAKVFPRPEGSSEPPAPASKVDVVAVPETITVRGRSYDCTKLTSTVTTPGGRRTTITDWCSEQVPFPAVKDGVPVGGLVRREFGRYLVELVDFGEGAREELRIPR